MNFGGFIPLSTVDWRGHSSCVVFFRGCPLDCFYCHNEQLKGGSDIRDDYEIVDMIYSSKPYVSSVVFSGGEPLSQPSALSLLAYESKQMGLKVGLHTSGINPYALEFLVKSKLIDYIALDVKSAWWNYPEVTGNPNGWKLVEKSIEVIKWIKEREIVFTVFESNKEDAWWVAHQDPSCRFVLNQGNIKGKKSLSEEDLKGIAKVMRRGNIYIRTKENGEIKYEENR